MHVNAGIILAAGRGRRYGAETPKQFVEVRGKPVLAYALEAFQRAAAVDALAVVCREADFDRVRGIARAGGVNKLRWLAAGGDSCPRSIRNGLYALRDDLEDGDNVLIHMGVSPLVSPEDIDAAAAVCAERGCCFTMYPVNVCLARGGGDGWAGADAPKENYVELNTPWAFRYGDVYRLYRQLEAEGRVLSPTDYTLGLWLASGRRAWYVRGRDPGRLKITTAHDRELFEGYLALRESKL